MSTYKVLIVEDELIIAEDLKSILLELGHEVCGLAISAREALVLLETHSPDLVLLDIQIKGGMDGIDLASEIRAQYKTPFVYLTSHADPTTLQRAKETNPYGYLVKPYQEKDINATIEIAINNFMKENEAKTQSSIDSGLVVNDSLFVRNGGMLVKLKFNDIAYIEADGNYSNIFASDKKYVVRYILKDLESKLTDYQFARVHKSFLINLNAIEAIDSTEVHVGNKKIPISRNQHTWLLSHVKTL
ncbi:response regulator transcription factor [Fulvivirga sp. RKSG066]|nr:response regulator transcription factor [Fulvivirga aurantia]